MSDRGSVRRGSAPPGKTKAGRPIKLCRGKSGYLVFTASVGGELSCVPAHRLVAEAFLGPRPDGHVIDHKNGKKRDNRADNLEYVTRAENERRANALGLKACGERHGCAKLSVATVIAIRSDMAVPDRNVSAIARKHGVSRRLCSKIGKGELWKSLGRAVLAGRLAERV